MSSSVKLGDFRFFPKSLVRCFSPTAHSTTATSLPSRISEPIAFSFSIKDTLFATAELRGHLYFHNSELYFDVPEGEEVELVTGGPPYRVDSEPEDLGASQLSYVVISASTEGEAAKFRLYSYLVGGEVLHQEGALKNGRIRLNAPADVQVASRVCLSLAGEGQVKINGLNMVYAINNQVVSAQKDDAPTNALLDLITPDYLKARKSGAEIPPPELPSIF